MNEKKNNRTITTGLLLIIILGIGLFFRLFQLGSIPHGFTFDELGYLYNAMSIAHTGANIFGQRFPIFTYMVPNGFPFMPVPMYLNVFLFLFLPFTEFTARLLNVLLGVGDIVLVYLLAKELFDEESVALVSAFALAISPWHIFFTRTGYDTPVAIFFYLLGLLTVVKSVTSSQYIWFAMSSFALALFCYRGMTPVFVGICAVSILYLWRMGVKPVRLFRSYALPLVGVALLFLLVGWMDRSHGFFKEASIDTTELTRDIVAQSRESRAPLWATRLFINKPVAQMTAWASQYIEGYNPGLLFLYGEGTQRYTMWMRGKLYLVDALVIVIGLIYLVRQRRWDAQSIFLIGLLIAAGLPGAVAGQPYATRNFFMTVPMALFVGVGWSALWQRKYRYGIIVLFVLLYGWSSAHFWFDYAHRYAYQRSEDWAESLKTISLSIQEKQKNYPKAMYVLEGVTMGDVVAYGLYTHVSPTDMQRAWSTQTPSSLGYSIHLSSVDFVPTCQAASTIPITTGAYFVRHECWKEATPSSVIQDFYGNTLWKVYEK